MAYIEKKKHYTGKYRKRKICFWLALILLFLAFILMYFYYPFKSRDNKHIIRAGICGAVKQPAVYSIPKGADLSTLVRLANGITADANIDDTDLGEIVMNDTIYHIQGRGDKNRQAVFEKEVRDILSHSSLNSLGDTSIQANDSIRQYNVLYVGLPAVYILIRYYPTMNRIDMTYIPHSTSLLVNDYRLIDIFFTLDIKPTMRLIENKLKCKIDRYMIQDRSGFIDMIDALGGLDINLDKSYADAYKLNPGKQRISGFHAWEYIRYIDMKSIKVHYSQGKDVDLIHKDNFKADPMAWQQIYNTRVHRQKLVLQSMYQSLLNAETEQQINFIQKFSLFVRTDMDKNYMISMYKDIYAKPQINLTVLPGYYQGEGDKLFYYPDVPGFNMLKNGEIRKNLKGVDKREQVIY